MARAAARPSRIDEGIEGIDQHTLRLQRGFQMLLHFVLVQTLDNLFHGAVNDGPARDDGLGNGVKGLPLARRERGLAQAVAGGDEVGGHQLVALLLGVAVEEICQRGGEGESEGPFPHRLAHQEGGANLLAEGGVAQPCLLGRAKMGDADIKHPQHAGENCPEPENENGIRMTLAPHGFDDSQNRTRCYGFSVHKKFLEPS